jgi:restriction system protein
MYVLRFFGLELTRVGGTGDQGIDGIGIAPISLVLSSRVAVQAKRYDPTSRSIGREVVALFQHDAAAASAERAVFVNLGRFSEGARQAAITNTPTVDLRLTVPSSVSLSGKSKSASKSCLRSKKSGSID